MKQSAGEQKPQSFRCAPSSACPKPRPACEKSTEYFPQKFAEMSSLTQKIDIGLVA
jgi:hypothetical protein